MSQQPTDPKILRAVMEHAPDLLLLSDVATARLDYLNPAGRRLLELTEPLPTHLSAYDLLADAGARQAGDIEAELARRGEWRGVTDLRCFSGGAPIPVAVSVFLLGGEGGAPTVLAAIARDHRQSLAQEHNLQRALDAAAYRAREQEMLAELSRLAVNADLHTVLSAATDAAASLMGMQCSSIARRAVGEGNLTVVAYTGAQPQPTALSRGDGSQAGYALATSAVVICPDRQSESRFATTAMALRGLRSGISIPIGNDELWGVLTASSAQPREYTDRDVSFLSAVASVLGAAIHRIELEQRLRHQSRHDPLTGLPNRTLAFERIGGALQNARARNSAIALMLVDLDGFKAVNDSLGHSAGDVVLVSIAQRLASVVRPSDTVARLGGDEFLVLCTDIDTSITALDIARRLMAAVRLEHASGVISASVGIALSDQDSTVDELIGRADLAMYRAKASGAGRSEIHDMATSITEADRDG